MSYLQERPEMHIRNADIIAVIDNLAFDDEAVESLRLTIRNALVSDVGIDISIKRKLVEVECDVCKPVQEIWEKVGGVDGLEWDDPKVLRIRQSIGLRLSIRIYLERHPDFKSFLKYIKHEEGVCVLKSHGRFANFNKIVYKLLKQFVDNGDGQGVGNKVIERFLAEKLKEYYGIDMQVFLQNSERDFFRKRRRKIPDISQNESYEKPPQVSPRIK